MRRLSVRISTSSAGKPDRVGGGAAAHHPERRIDLVAVDLQARFEAAVELLQHRRRRFDRRRRAADGDDIAARRERRRDLLLDQREVLVVLTEQQRAERIVVEAQGLGGDVGRQCGNRFQAHAAGFRGCCSKIAGGGRRERLGRQAVGVLRGDPHLDQVADRGAGRGDVHRLQMRRAADQLARMAPGALQQDRHGPADARLLEGAALLRQQRLEPLQALVLDLILDRARAGRPRACRGAGCT